MKEWDNELKEPAGKESLFTKLKNNFVPTILKKLEANPSGTSLTNNSLTYGNLQANEVVRNESGKNFSVTNPKKDKFSSG